MYIEYSNMAAPVTPGKFPLKSAEINRNPPETVIFHDLTIRTKAPDSDQTEVKEGDGRGYNKLPAVISLKRAKFDVRKFGISGFDRQQKEEAKIQLAVELGARPYKRKGKNYKEFVAELKAKKTAELEQREKERQMGITLPKVLKPKPKKGERVRSLKCQVGRYENGFQIIPKGLLSSKQRLQLNNRHGQPSD